MSTPPEPSPHDPAHLAVPARRIPVPASISPQAQAALAATFDPAPYPPLDDPDGWRRMIAASDASLLTRFEARIEDVAASVTERSVDGVPVFDIMPDDLPDARSPFVYLDIHGGALIMGSGACCRAMGTRAMARVGVRTVSVDYRMPPDHPYPAALDDCVAVYGALLREHDPAHLIVGGSSAGGNLAAALVLRARDEGLPLPAAAVLVSPELDLTESGDSFHTNLGVDTVLRRSLMPANFLYANGHDLRHPYLSPLFGDFATGFPPTFVQAGTRDLFLSNAVRMHRALRAAQVPVELHVFEAMPHGGFFGAPEDLELEQEIRRFVDGVWRL